MQKKIAYFSMEMALHPSIPTYAGGLGVLAGDTVRAAADLGVHMVGVTLLHRHGYFHQRLDAEGNQAEEGVEWPINDYLEPLNARVRVELEDREVVVGSWKYLVQGITGFTVPVILLDTDQPENEPADRRLTDDLYGGDEAHRLSQEIVLGLGGVRMLKALGYDEPVRFHLNEGHAALILAALIEELDAEDLSLEGRLNKVRDRCVFTTHTPVPAGHDRFSIELARRLLGSGAWNRLKRLGVSDSLNMTDLALKCSGFVNGVAMKHGEVSRSLFPGYPIRSITNGVHTATWAAPSFQRLFDTHLPGWRKDSFFLRYAIGIPGSEVWAAHVEAKRRLIEYVNREANAGFDRDVLTIGFARRATAYKRAALVFKDLPRLRSIAERSGGIQFVFAGKAHPMDSEGKEVIRSIHRARNELRGAIPVAYLPNHDMVLAGLLCAGCDVWLNSPLPPLEASGTSGMKAAVNGVPSLSVLDGWWIEGHIEGVTGWSIGDHEFPGYGSEPDADTYHSRALYEKLESRVLPTFYRNRSNFVEMMKSTISHNGAFFSAQRMVWQYYRNAYSE